MCKEILRMYLTAFYLSNARYTTTGSSSLATTMNESSNASFRLPSHNQLKERSLTGYFSPVKVSFDWVLRVKTETGIPGNEASVTVPRNMLKTPFSVNIRRFSCSEYITMMLRFAMKWSSRKPAQPINKILS